MRLGYPLSPLLAIVLSLGLAAPAEAQDDPVPTRLTMSGPAKYADSVSPLAIRLVHTDDSAVVGGEVVVERRRSGTWGVFETVVTDAQGRAVVDATLAKRASDNVFRASYAGDLDSAPDQTGPVAVRLVRREGRVSVGGPDSVVDEQSVRVSVRWRTGNGLPVNGVVRLQKRIGDSWRLVRRLRTGSDGRAHLSVRPRSDTRWRAQASRLDWVTGDTSGVHRIDNLPPGNPVRLPSGAPRPRVDLPDQRHAVGAGPNASIKPIPDGVWNQMTGRTWHRGCPVGRSGLRYLQINYWDYRGYRRRGELVASAGAIGRMSAALAEMYHKKLPIRAMYRVDRFGWSDRVRGGDDYKSMAAGNTSAFNCRDVVGNPGVRSPHSYGRSLDINTWENPYRSRQGTVPNTWWMGHSHPRVAWRSRSHAVVQVMARHGLRWTYGNGDTQHFDAYGSSGRMAARYATCEQGCT